jgi:hypothetical protein
VWEDTLGLQARRSLLLAVSNRQVIAVQGLSSKCIRNIGSSHSEPDAAVPGLKQLPHKTLFEFTIDQAGAPALVERWLRRVRSL